VAYNYHWTLDYILLSFDDEYVKKLLDDAILFNPWASKHKEPEEVPQDIRQQIMDKRKQWEEGRTDGDDPRTDS
jgi:hypothetical protein